MTADTLQIVNNHYTYTLCVNQVIVCSLIELL